MFWRRSAYIAVYFLLFLIVSSTSSAQIVSFQIASSQSTSSQSTSEHTPPLQKPRPVQAQIVGGDAADVGEWPWQVYILAGPFQCGGTLIDPNWVLTAAHCLLDEFNNPLTADEVAVRLGIHALDNLTGVQTILADEVFMHEGYSLVTNDNDIGLIKLSESAQLNENVATIRLIVDNEEFDTLAAPGTDAWVTGWGTTEFVSIATILQEVEVPIVDYETCNGAGSYDGRITENMFCAGEAAGGRDACQGDSGGPLVVPDGDGWAQAGIISWGDGCAVENFYGVYASIHRYKAWLTNYVDEVGLPTPIPTSTEVPPTETFTPIPPTPPPATPTLPPTPTLVPTELPTLVISATATITPTRIVTPTMTPIMTPLVTPTVAITNTPTITLTPAVTATATTTVTATSTPTVTRTVDPTLEPTLEPTQVPTVVPTIALTVIATSTATLMPTDTAISTPQSTPISISTLTPTPTPTLTLTPTPTPTSMAAETVTAVHTPLSTASPPPTIAPSPPVTGDLKNADFELGANGDWLESSSQFGGQGSLIYPEQALEQYDFEPHAGMYLAWLGGVNMESSALLQTVALPDYEKIALEFYYTINSEDECGKDTAEVTVDDDLLLTLELCAENNSAEWLKGTVDLSAYAKQTVALGIRVQTDDERLSSFFVDSFALRDATIDGPNDDVFDPTATPTSERPLESALPLQIEAGDFEPDALNAWIQSGADTERGVSMIVSTVEYETGNQISVDAYSGTHVAQLGMTNSADAALLQRIQLPDAEKIALRFMYQIRSEDACGYDEIDVFVEPLLLDDGTRSRRDEEPIAGYSLCEDQQTDEWTSATLDVSLWRGRAVEVGFAVNTDAVGLSGFYIDDVEILTGNAVAVVVAPQAIQLEVLKAFGARAASSLRIDAPDEMTWRAEVEQADWLSIAQNGVMKRAVESVGQAKLDLQIDAANLASGRYTGTITLTATDSGSIATLQPSIPVELSLVENPTKAFVPEPLTLVADSGINGNRLSWTAAANPHIVKYRVARQQGNAFRAIATVAAATSFTDIANTGNPLQSDTAYCYRIDGLVAPEFAETHAFTEQMAWAQSNTVCLSIGALTLTLPALTAAPADQIVLPINVQNATNLRPESGALHFTFDNRSLRITDVASTAFAPDLTWTFEIKNLGANLRQLTATFENNGATQNAEQQSGAIRGDGPLALIKAQVVADDPTRANLVWLQPASANAGRNATHIVAQGADGTLRQLSLTLQDGTLTVTQAAQFKLGDVDGDGLVQVADAQANLSLAASNAKPLYAQMRAGDLTGDGQIHSADAAMILHYLRNGAWPFEKSTLRTVEAASVFMRQDAAQESAQESATVGFTTESVTPGEPFSSTLWVDGLINFTSADLIINYDPSIVARVNSVSMATHESLAGYLIGFDDNQSGQLKIAFAGDVPLQGDWSLINIEMQARTDAVVGSNRALTVANIAINDELGRNQADPISGTGITVGSGQIEVIDPTTATPQNSDSSDFVFLPLINAGAAAK